MKNQAYLWAVALLLSAGCQKFNWDANSATAKKDPAAGPTTTPANQVQTPFFTPAAGAYNVTQNVAIASATAGANICYTVDGSTPACDNSGNCSAGTLYAGTITVAASQSVNALGCKASMDNSVLLSGAYVIDSVPPVITAVAPIAASVVTTTQVTYTLSENCGSGTITWTRTGGTADGLSPHVKQLVGSELAIGAHTGITIANNPAVVANAVYDIAFDCTDPAGNVAATVTSTGVTIDNVPPIISSTAPGSGAAVPNTTVSYTLSENCTTASITWTRTAGTADGGSPHAQALVAGELTAGVHNAITLTSNPALISGTVYTLDFNCTDAAGNAATVVSNTSVTYDNVAPVISAVAPTTSAAVNNTQVSYTFSENCASASITWTRTSGTADGGSPHVQSLLGAELTAGAHPGIVITNNPTLVNGTIYTVGFNCTDAAGNVAAAVNSTSVSFINVAVVISAVTPATNAFMNTTQVSFTLSGNCTTGSVTWTRTGGTADPGSPRLQSLVGVELLAGAHTSVTLTSNPALVDGTIYDITFNCTDIASNASTPITLNNVTYDFTAPVISGVAPAASTYVNNQQVSYTLSETCATGIVNWTYTSGTVSGNFNQGLVAGELTAGAHNNFTISNNPVLVSGATYTITFSCSDAAGNAATAISRTAVTFDNTPPTVVIRNLLNNGTVNTGFMIGTGTDNTVLTAVDVSLDAGAYSPAVGTATWNFALPSGVLTWVHNSQHTIDVRGTDAAGNIFNAPQITVRKGNNQDVNGDGYGEMAVGAWQYLTATGRAYVFHGSSVGVASGGAAAANKVLTGAATNNFFGRNMAFGDFNGDGFADLAIAAYGFSTNTGQVTIYNGSGGGLSGVPSVTIPGVANSQFGSVLVAGNANNDPYTDLVIASNAWSASQGRVQVFLGGGGGMATTATIAIPGEAGTSQFGSSIALGDFDGDTNPDLAVGASAYSTNFGRAYIFYGSAGTLSAGTPSFATAIATGASGDFYGASMAAGDINGDGVTDLAVGAYGFSTNTGRIYLYNGAGGTGITLGNAGTPTTTFTGEAIGNYFTTSIAIADIHADGFADVIVGAYGYGSSAGRSYVFSGQAAPLTSGAATLAGTILSGETITTNFGRGSGAFDVNGDGRPDVIHGANLYGGSQGRAYIFHSPITGSINATAASSTLTGEAGTTEFGINISR